MFEGHRVEESMNEIVYGDQLVFYMFLDVNDTLYRVNKVTGETWRCDGWNWTVIKEHVGTDITEAEVVSVSPEHVPQEP